MVPGGIEPPERQSLKIKARSTLQAAGFPGRFFLAKSVAPVGADASLPGRSTTSCYHDL
jgi:hypothetical protein